MFLQNQPALRHGNCHNFINKMVHPLTLMSPMYIAGRLRTASRPSSTCMLSADIHLFLLLSLLVASSIFEIRYLKFELVAAKSQVSSTLLLSINNPDYVLKKLHKKC